VNKMLETTPSTLYINLIKFSWYNKQDELAYMNNYLKINQSDSFMFMMQ